MQVGYSYECMTTSDIKEDFLCHLKYFKPHVYIHFIGDSASEEAFKIFELKRELSFMKTPIIVIGNKEDCEIFSKTVSTDLAIKKPISSKKIEEMLNSFLEKNISLKPESESTTTTSFATFESVSEKKPKTIEPKNNGKKHILIIDDDKSVLKMLKQYLSNNYEITAVTSGRMGRKYLEKNTTDLILLDYEMPEESGFQVYKGLLGNLKTKDIPVIFLTGVADKEKIRDVLELRPRGYLLKPIDIKKLQATVSKVFYSNSQNF